MYAYGELFCVLTNVSNKFVFRRFPLRRGALAPSAPLRTPLIEVPVRTALGKLSCWQCFYRHILSLLSRKMFAIKILKTYASHQNTNLSLTYFVHQNTNLSYTNISFIDFPQTSVMC